MVHTCNDIQSLGVDTLRNVYRSADLSIRPKARASSMNILKEVMRAMGMNPE